MTPTRGIAARRVRAWAASSWDPALSLREWRERLRRRGLGRAVVADASGTAGSCRRGPTTSWHDEIATCGAVAVGAVGPALAGPTILEQGPDLIRERFLRPILTGEERVVPAVQRAGRRVRPRRAHHHGRARRRRVGGQRPEGVEHRARTTPTSGCCWPAPTGTRPSTRASPTSCCRCSSRAWRSGPLRQMNGHASFNEVFLTDARIPRSCVVGEVGQGWTRGAGHARPRATLRCPRLARRLDGSTPGGPCDEARARGGRVAKAYAWYPQRAGRADLVVDHARVAGVADDPIVRQEVARVLVDETRERVDRRAGQGRPGRRAARQGRRARSASWR